MIELVYLSLVLNIAVLLPICVGMSRNADWVSQTWGQRSPARSILFSVYLSILLVSAGLLFWPEPGFVAALLLVQIVYKVTTPLTVGNLRHPVVISNLAISVVHAVTLFSLTSALGI